MNVPDDLLYTDEHEWIKRVSDTRVRIGITDYAQDQLGDVVFVELPEVGAVVEKEDLIVEVESTKSVGEVYAPFSGTIVLVNTDVAEAPELVNESPYDRAWFAELETDGPFATEGLLDATAYRDLTE
jgi:glycine cleavage system H protein